MTKAKQSMQKLTDSASAPDLDPDAAGSKDLSEAAAVSENANTESVNTETPNTQSAHTGLSIRAAQSRQSIWGTLIEVASTAGDSVSQVASTANTVVTDATVATGGAIAKAVVTTGEAVGSATSLAGETVMEASSATGQAIVSVASQTGQFVGNTGSALGTAVSQTSQLLGRAVGSAVTQATETTGSILEKLNDNPVLPRLTKLIPQASWLVDLVEQVDLVKASQEVERLQRKYPTESPGQIARRLMVSKALLAGGTGLATGLVPGAAAALFAVDLAATTQLQAEMVYQIAAAYGFDLDSPARKGEVLAVFGLSLGGGKALKAGGTYAAKAGWLGFLKNIPAAGAVIGASANAAMLYSIGYGACRFYDAQLCSANIDDVLVLTEAQSEDYLEEAIAQEVVMDWLLVYTMAAGHPDKTWSELLPELHQCNLSPASIDSISSNISSPPPLEKLLNQLDPNFAVALLVQCRKIVEADGEVSPEEAEIVQLIEAKSTADRSEPQQEP